MIKKLKKLKEKYGSAQVCVWLGLQDTRTLNTWLSRERVPFHMEEKVKEIIKERS
jgi:hypothetical protein